MKKMVYTHPWAEVVLLSHADVIMASGNQTTGIGLIADDGDGSGLPAVDWK